MSLADNFFHVGEELAKAARAAGRDPQSVTLLAVSGLSAGYGKAEVLHGVSLTVAARQLVAIVGPNGAGKTTLMHAVMGLLPRRGSVSLLGQDAGDVGWMVRQGVVLVPETRALFTDMSVEDNLLLGGFARRRRGGVRSRASAVAGSSRRFNRTGSRARAINGRSFRARFTMPTRS